MKTPKHTKGPWKVRNDMPNEPKNNGLFRVLPQNGKQGIAICGSESNAHLIAAAPEMLEALEHLKKELCEGEFVKHSQDAIKKLNNAIKKARGES